MSELLPPLLWHQPAWLLLLVAPLGLVVWRKRGGKRASPLEEHFDTPLLDRLIENSDKKESSIRLLTLLWILAAIAAAGPYLAGDEASPETRPGANVAIIVDISPSMAVADVTPNRIQLAKLQLIDFIRELDNTRLALIAFSANAYAILPLTADRSAFIHFVQALDPTLVTVAGSNLAQALRLANQSLAAQPEDGSDPPKGMAILISDGGIHDPSAWEEAKQLAQSGHRLFTVGVGSEVGGPVPLKRGQLVRQAGEILTSRLERGALTSLAEQGGGRYFDLSPQAWDDLKQTISRLERAQYQNSATAAQGGTPLYPLLIAIALALLLSHAWRRPELLSMALLAPLMVLHPSPTQAAPWSEGQAFAALQEREYEEAATRYQELGGYRGAFGLGVALYRLGHWTEAAQAFREALEQASDKARQASASYNLGNALAQLGQLEQAGSAYQATLALDPNHSKAKYNLAAITRFQQSPGADQPRPENEQHPGHGGSGEAGATEAISNRNANTDTPGSGNASLRQGRNGEEAGKMPTSAFIQLHNIEDDSTTMLRRRFSIEDERAAGLIEEKPW